MDSYLALLRDIRDNGTGHDDRTGTGTRRVFGRQLRFDLSQGFPLLTTKKLPFRWIAEELFWFLSGSTNVADLQARGVDIWDEWATPEQCARFGRLPGDLGPIYGHQWRNFGAERTPHITSGYEDDGVDQIARIVQQLIETPNSRRIILSAWNPKEAAEVAVPPCHTLSHFAVIEGKLSCQLYQRSADVFLGVPFNIASYALLTHMLAAVTGLGVGDFVHTFGDVHIYSNHMEQVEEQLSRDPRPLPKLKIRLPELSPPDQLEPHEEALDRLLITAWGDLTLEGYDPHPRIRAEVSV